MAEGRLMYRENADPTSALKGDMPLMGSAVSLMPAKETGKYYCFRLVSGVTSLVMQAESVEDMMDWASTLYHASFIANGGNHIVGLQRARAAHQKKKEEEAAKLEAVRNAELKKLEQDASRLQLAEEEMREEMNTVAVEANEALRNAMSLVRNTKPMNQQCIDTLKTALMNCRSIQGTDEVAIVEADMLWKNTVTVFEEQKVCLPVCLFIYYSIFIELIE